MVPVICMVEGVVWAVNSEVPEFVPAEELAQTPQQWNGRPAFAGHPRVDGTEVSGNTPSILEQSFGTVFETASAERILETRQLTFNVYMDPEKAKQVGPKAEDVVRRLQSGKQVEVSGGFYVEPSSEDGVFKGKEYHGVWHNIVSDHIAFLEEGQPGACSLEAGCGAPRVAVAHVITAEGIQREEPMAEPAKKRTLRERLGALVKGMRAQGHDENEIRSVMRDSQTLSETYRAVDNALRAVEPGYMGIDDVDPDEGWVIYCVCPTDEWVILRRKYKMSAEGVATLEGEAVRVEPVTTYEPVTAAESRGEQPCSCGRQQARETEEHQPTEGVQMTKEARIAALMAHAHNPFKNEVALKAMSEAELASLETLSTAAKTAADAPAPAAATTQTPAPVAAAATATTPAVTATVPAPVAAAAQSETEFLAAHPAIASIVNEHKAREQAERTTLVTKLAAASSILTAEQLSKKSTEDLRTLAQFAKLDEQEVAQPDFSGLGLPRPLAAAAAGGVNEFAAPSPYARELKAAREAQAK